LKQLMRPQPGPFLAQLTLAWATIALAAWLADYCQSLWVSAAAVVLIATRQWALALLMHEQVHRLAFRSRTGDSFCNGLIAYPLLVTVEGYRRLHLAHHQHYATAQDPDHTRKQGKEWTFPQRIGSLLKLLVTDATGIHVWRTLQGKRLPGSAKDRPALPGQRAAFYLALALFLVTTGTWHLFLLYWVLPLFTIFQAILRLGAVCEHTYTAAHAAVAESTPCIKPRWWESLLLPNLNFHTYHVYHHWYPGVPYSRLGRVHELFRREGRVREENVFDGFVQYLHYITGRRSRPSS
ncbi:MAG: fatty acid desaturase, partial [Gemmataceae bacterium]|nr:fatty acid desaturase [Gemmataceae bacterium]